MLLACTSIGSDFLEATVFLLPDLSGQLIGV